MPVVRERHADAVAGRFGDRADPVPVAFRFNQPAETFLRMVQQKFLPGIVDAVRRDRPLLEANHDPVAAPEAAAAAERNQRLDARCRGGLGQDAQAFVVGFEHAEAGRTGDALHRLVVQRDGAAATGALQRLDLAGRLCGGCLAAQVGKLECRKWQRFSDEEQWRRFRIIDAGEGGLGFVCGAQVYELRRIAGTEGEGQFAFAGDA